MICFTTENVQRTPSLSSPQSNVTPNLFRVLMDADGKVMLQFEKKVITPKGSLRNEMVLFGLRLVENQTQEGYR